MHKHGTLLRQLLLRHHQLTHHGAMLGRLQSLPAGLRGGHLDALRLQAKCGQALAEHLHADVVLSLST